MEVVEALEVLETEECKIQNCQ